jgi:predicted Holliday junction resolvase-like endonuclease
MILILLIIVLFVVILEIEHLHSSLNDLQYHVSRINNRSYELQGAIKVLLEQKTQEVNKLQKETQCEIIEEIEEIEEV